MKQDLFLEAESFRELGGWVIDPAAMGQMGSAYLMAHGAGVPVADAATAIELAEAAEYHAWVRTRDWTAVWKRGAPAGCFTLKIDGIACRPRRQRRSVGVAEGRFARSRRGGTPRRASRSLRLQRPL